jgi:hypothetical protein
VRDTSNWQLINPDTSYSVDFDPATIAGGILDIPVSNITFPAPSVRAGEPARVVNIILTKHITEDSKDLIQHAADLIEPATFRQGQLSAQSEQWQLAIKDIKKLTYIKDVPSVSINIKARIRTAIGPTTLWIASRSQAPPSS